MSLLLVLGATAWACGGQQSTSPGEESPAGPEAAAGGAAGAIVSVATIESCAGFTAEMAAKFLAVPVAEIKADHRKEHDTLQLCSFRSTESFMKTVSFSLGWEDTVAEARQELARERELLGIAKGAIGRVTGSEETGPASQEIDGVGEEAFFTTVNDTLVARVGNVRVQVIMPDDDLEQMKEIARAIVAGLR